MAHAAEIRFITDEEREAFRLAVIHGFGGDPEPSDDTADERFWLLNPLQTCIAAFDRGKVVATFNSFDLEIAVPGERMVAMAGTSHVTVHPTHRRQGILTEMMRLHLEQAAERGQPIAGLWASEERIYGRFGYGPAANGHVLEIKPRTVETASASAGVTVHPLSLDEARTTLPPIYQRRLASVPGRLARSEEVWEWSRFFDPAWRARGQGRLRHVVAEREGSAVGYLAFRLESQGDWSEGRTHVIEMIADDDEARRALWYFATNVDLYRQVRWWNAPVDDPLLVEADRFRAVDQRVFDTVWVRPLDVPAALQARGYERDGTVVLDVRDDFGPAAGRFRLEVVDGVGTCGPTDSATPNEMVSLDVSTLGRLFLGGVSAMTLQRAGLVEGNAVAAARVHDLFTTRAMPHCSEVF